MTGGRLDELVHATHPGWITEINRATVIGRGYKLRVIDLADWGFDRSSRGFRLSLASRGCFGITGTSGQFETLVKSCAKSAKKRETAFSGIPVS